MKVIWEMSPETKYGLSGKVNIAYQVVGDGPLDLVLVPGFVSNIEVFWEEPGFVRFIRRLTDPVALTDEEVHESYEAFYRTRPSRTAHSDGEVARWDGYELIARVLDHLPPHPRPHADEPSAKDKVIEVNFTAAGIRLPTEAHWILIVPGAYPRIEKARGHQRDSAVKELRLAVRRRSSLLIRRPFSRRLRPGSAL